MSSMDKNTKEKLYNKLNDLLDMLHEGEAKEYVKDLINEIYYDKFSQMTHTKYLINKPDLHERFIYRSCI